MSVWWLGLGEEAGHQAARLAGGDLRKLETRAERVGLQGVGGGVMAGEGVG